MSGLTLERLLFDPAVPVEGPLVGSYLLGAGGTVISETGTALDVNIASAMGLGIYAEDAAAVSGDLGQPALVLRQDTLAPGATSTDGDYAWLKSNVNGELYVLDTSSLARLVLINSDTTSINGHLATIDTNLASLRKAEDAAHSSGDFGVMSLAVRNDTGAVLAGADGDYIPFSTDSLGRLYVSGVLAGAVADDAVDSGNPIKMGSRSTNQAVALSAISAAGDRADLISDLYRKLYVNSSSTIPVSHAAVTTGLTEVAIPAVAGQTRVMLQNVSDKSIFIGATGVSVSGATRGLEISKGGTFAGELTQSSALFAISSAAAKDLVVFRY